MEVYDRSRFAIVTGDVYEGHGELALDCADVLEDLYQAEFAERAPRETRVEPREEVGQRVSDEHAVCWLIAHYRQGRTLFERGDLMRWEQARRRYDQKADLSRSVADYSLAVMLLAATDGCQEQAVRLMRRSALARPKYEEVHDGVRPYVEMTVANAAARMDPAVERARAIERGNEYLEAHYPSDARRLVELMRRDEVTHWQLRTYLCSQALVDVRVGRRDGCESFPLAWLVDRWEEVSAALYRYDFERVVQEG